MSPLLASAAESLSDVEAACAPLKEIYEQLAALPEKERRSAVEQETAAGILTEGRARRETLLRSHAQSIYAELTDGFQRDLRVSDLVYAAAERFPGLVPSRAQIAAQRGCLQKAKDGLEIDQGIFVSHVLAVPSSGFHLIHAMARPRPEAAALMARMRGADSWDLGPVSVRRDGNVGYLYLQNHEYLNAEDDASTAALETAVDWVLLDDRIDIGVMRGAPATHPKWSGRRVYGTGINLTHLYEGRISLLEFFLERELGAVGKIYRGHSVAPSDGLGPDSTHEKPWIAAVESCAIGGGCQFLFVMDWVIAESGAKLSIPAAREGIVPGCGNMRLPRYVDEALARKTLFENREFCADDPDGSRFVQEVVPPEKIDVAIEEAASRLLRCGVDSVTANRRALRAAVEPLDMFRRYLAGYARDQAYCMYSPKLVDNLERTWISARESRPSK